MEANLVTVLIPVFNGGSYLKAAILSVMTQDYSALEILIIDDGSTDGSNAVLQELAQSDSRIRLITRENRGLVATLNEGIAVASGRYIARMDADDIAYPGRISQQLSMFADDARLGLVGTAVDYLYGSDRLFPGHFGDLSGRDIRIQMLFNPFFYHPAVMFNLGVISRQTLRYDPVYRHNEDFDLFRRIANLHEVAFQNLPGLAWRQGHSSVSRRHEKEQSRMHLQIVGEQLHSAGVVQSLDVLNEAVDAWAQGKMAERDQLVHLLDSIWRFDSYRGADREAYERGFQTFLVPLLRQMTLLANARRSLDTISLTGLFGKLPWRMRVERRLASYFGDATAEVAVRSLAATTRRFRSKSLVKTVKLSRSVIAALP